MRKDVDETTWFNFSTRPSRFQKAITIMKYSFIEDNKQTNKQTNKQIK
jgi:hypothetical protein